jgi:hypothetical protein
MPCYTTEHVCEPTVGSAPLESHDVMPTWTKLNHLEYNQVWDTFDAEFEFGKQTPDGLVIQEPAPSITYDISDAFTMEFAPWGDPAIHADVHGRFLAAFQSCVAPGETLYALDWQHDAYHFDPHQPFAWDDLCEWKVPIIPNGDYYIHIAKDFSFGTFGHPWELTLCVFGEQLLTIVRHDPPALLNKVIRRNDR